MCKAGETKNINLCIMEIISISEENYTLEVRTGADVFVLNITGRNSLTTQICDLLYLQAIYRPHQFFVFVQRIMVDQECMKLILL